MPHPLSINYSSPYHSYRRLAVTNYQEGKSDKFLLVSEAYDVLSEPCRRALYDQYGEEGMKKGVPTSDGFILPYVYHGDAIRTFRYGNKFIILFIANRLAIEISYSFTYLLVN